MIPRAPHQTSVTSTTPPCLHQGRVVLMQQNCFSLTSQVVFEHKQAVFRSCTLSILCNTECCFCVGFEGQGKVNQSSRRITEEWLQMRPLVQCSPAAITLTAKGWNYVHFLVKRGWPVMPIQQTRPLFCPV